MNCPSCGHQNPVDAPYCLQCAASLAGSCPECSRPTSQDAASCPHCGAELSEVYAREKGVPFVQGCNVVYFCPHCRKVLGFGQGRMI